MSEREFPNGLFMLGDCLGRMRELPDASVDMILCDLPYGTTQNKWDVVVPFEPLWAQYWRVAKPGAAVVLTADQPFTSALVMSQAERFRYSWHWHKVQPTGFLNAKKMPLKAVEDVCVFYDKLPPYNPQMAEGRVIKRTKSSSSSSSNYRQGIVQSGDQSSGNARYPTTLLEISKGQSPNARPLHPTQKPVALFEYLIRTYTDEGMTVLDNCAGSGTTAVAAERTGRRWVCIERDPDYFAKAVERVEAETNRLV